MDLSVIIPIYNHEQYIEQCLNTILEDFPENSEIIIIDDVCTDSSIDRIKKINSEKIKIYRNKENIGCARSLNKGIKLAQGNYIGINYSDDFVENGFYKKLLEVAKQENADVVCGNIADYNEEKQETIYNRITEDNIFYERNKKNINLKEEPYQVDPCFLLGHWTASSASTKIIKKELYEKHEFYGSKSNDIPAIYPIMAEADKIIYYPGLYLVYREIENSLSRKDDPRSYNSVIDTIIKAFKSIDKIDKGKQVKEILFFNNCLKYLFFILGNIEEKETCIICTRYFLHELKKYDNNIFKEMKNSDFYIPFMMKYSISQEIYSLLENNEIEEYITKNSNYKKR